MPRGGGACAPAGGAAPPRHALEHGHHVDLGGRRRCGGGSAARGLAAARSPALPRFTIARTRRRRHHSRSRQVLVEVGVDRVDLAKRRLVELLQDLELDPLRPS